MIKTGLEIVEMIAKGEAPNKIKQGGYIYEYNGLNYFFKDKPINLLVGLHDEFEIIEDKVWKPSDGEKYWFLNACGIILHEFWGTPNANDLRYAIGNCFKTEQEAKKYLEKIKIYTQLKRYAEEHNVEKIDWKNEGQDKFYIYYGSDYKELRIASTCFFKDIWQIYFTSKELCEQAIKEIGEDNIKKLFEEE